MTAAFRATLATRPDGASVAKARVVVNGQTIPSPGISSAPSAPGPEVGLAGVELLEVDRAGLARIRSPRAVASMPASASRCSALQAIISAPRFAVGMPTRAAYSPSSS